MAVGYKIQMPGKKRRLIDRVQAAFKKHSLHFAYGHLPIGADWLSDNGFHVAAKATRELIAELGTLLEMMKSKEPVKWARRYRYIDGTRNIIKDMVAVEYGEGGVHRHVSSLAYEYSKWN